MSLANRAALRIGPSAPILVELVSFAGAVPRPAAGRRRYAPVLGRQLFLVSLAMRALISFTLSGAQPIMVSNLHLCGEQCSQGRYLLRHGIHEINIYVRTGDAWRNALSTTTASEFLSFDYGEWAFKFKAVVLAIPGSSEDCPKRRAFMRTFGPTAWKRRAM